MGDPVREPPTARLDQREARCTGGGGRRARFLDRQHPIACQDESWLNCRLTTPACRLTLRTSPPNATPSSSSASIPNGSTSTTASPGPTGLGPGCGEAMAACRAGDTLVVTKLDRLARSLPDAREILADLTTRQVKLELRRHGARPHRSGRTAAVQRVGDGRRVRSRPDPAAHPRGHEDRQGEGPPARQAAQAQPSPGSPPGRSPPAGEHGVLELGDLFGATRSTVYRAVERAARRRAQEVPAAGSVRCG